MKHHDKSSKTVEKAAIKLIGESQFKENSSKRDIDDIKKHAESMIRAHLERGKGLATLITQE